mmetsp:Transcript_36389/g.114067  ORF Transcript_36389/g.114067 Transcript_36389/m.114067 type:complete len:201 (-) Transcript_36389:123-725(-)
MMVWFSVRLSDERRRCGVLPHLDSYPSSRRRRRKALSALDLLLAILLLLGRLGHLQLRQLLHHQCEAPVLRHDELKVLRAQAQRLHLVVGHFEELADVLLGLGHEVEHQVCALDGRPVLHVLPLDDDAVVVQDHVRMEPRHHLQLLDDLLGLVHLLALHGSWDKIAVRLARRGFAPASSSVGRPPAAAAARMAPAGSSAP